MTAASTHPPFDPELSVTLAALPPELQHPLLPEDIPAWREQIGLLPGGDELLLRDGAVGLEERQVPGPEGAPDLSVLILRPAQGSGGRAQAMPGIYYVHGGGMVLGSNRTGADQLALWVDEIGAVGVSVEYRLAPEHPHPAPVEDCYAGLAWTARHAGELGIDPALLRGRRFHVHVPAGAVPKDGPSAGVTMTTALVSLLTGVAVRADVGMTGEVTLQGRVLPIGGVKQKVLAAHRAGLTTVILPKRNELDLEDVPEAVRRQMTFHLADQVTDVLAVALDTAGVAVDAAA